MPIPLLASWKPLFYDHLLPTLRRRGPSACDAALESLGRTLAAWPPRRWRLAQALTRAKSVLNADWDLDATRRELAANIPRFLARDYPLSGATDAEVFDRFEVSGLEHLETALDEQRGVVLLGSHLGAYLSALHWLQRRAVPLRLMVQNPRHVSTELRRLLDGDDRGPHPQQGFFLRRALSPSERALRTIRAHAALRNGLAVYINGDVAWPTGCTRPGRFLGRHQRFLSAWADLAVLTQAPVIPVFCLHRPGGRFALSFDPPWRLSPGSEEIVIPRYLNRLEAEIRAHPADAVAHLLWPSFNPPDEPPSPVLPSPHLTPTARDRSAL